MLSPQHRSFISQFFALVLNLVRRKQADFERLRAGYRSCPVIS